MQRKKFSVNGKTTEMPNWTETTIRRFRECGVGASFLDMRLDSLGKSGAAVLKWALNDGGVEALKAGRGFTLVGEAHESRNAVGVVAANLMKENTCKVFMAGPSTLLQIIGWSTRNNDYYYTELEECKVLVVPDLHEFTPGGVCPFSPREVIVLSEYLRTRMEEDTAIICTSSVRTANMYWGESLLGKIQSRNVEIVVGGA
jgi:hypothetical protein